MGVFFGCKKQPPISRQAAVICYIILFLLEGLLEVLCNTDGFLMQYAAIRFTRTVVSRNSGKTGSNSFSIGHLVIVKITMFKA
jgi:hypothetical protein